ncbi:hypothetical protein [Aeromonas caviae]|uniref:hypothetical protein n=1 Tax=Aeromonas caviae TaxID=648 RepID=UPI001CF0A078|nr:hypothetical protein [Aeromonas caviae]UCM49376.1 hypothetical protein LEO79_00095 [Aeromonas caviae]
MALLLRKVIARKWLKNKDLELDVFSSDPITACNKTTDDTLSVWRCNSMDFDSDDELQMIIAGLASGFNGPVPHDFLFIDEAELISLGLNVEDKVGTTAFKAINDKHANICGINYKNLGVVSEYIRNKVCEDDAKMLVLTKEQVVACVKRFYKAGELKMRIKDDSPWKDIK